VKHATAVKRLKLALLAVLGICSVSIPVTIAVVLSSTGASDLLTLGPGPAASATAAPATAARTRACRPTRGFYALAFEDGPLPEKTARLVATLRGAGARAVFFDVGERAAARPDLVALQKTAGIVANHGYTHVRLTAMSQARRLQELQATARILGYPNAFVQPPYGASDAAVDRDIRGSGLVPVYWTLDLGDGPRSSAEIVAKAGGVTAGGIILLHEGDDAALRAVAPLVRALRAQGLCPGTLARTSRTIVAGNGAPFNVEAVRP
jgi:peptidoglycan/xylan/chitin deacetylase (PgdA/CDA1 family)